MYLLCSIRTNIAFVIVFLTLVIAFSLITGAYWALAQDYAGNSGFAANLQEVRFHLAYLLTARPGFTNIPAQH